MFVEINGAMHNMYSISSFKAVDKKVENSSGTHEYTDIFYIVYVTVNGITIEEAFQEKDKRDAKLDMLSTKFVVTDEAK